jgi:beta-lactam-binding protein with PASTA domain
MTFREYLTSRQFVKQLALMVAIVVGIVLIFIFWLDFTTSHGEEIDVPNLAKMTETQAEEALSELDLEYIVLDSVEFRKEFPKFTVVEQDPKPGSKVKKGRKIYLKLNTSGYASVKIPDLIEKTFRQAEPTLKALGLEVGNISYKPYLGKDMVLEMRHNGKKLKPGDKVLKASKIDLVLGDGKIAFEESVDTLTHYNPAGNE